MTLIRNKTDMKVVFAIIVAITFLFTKTAGYQFVNYDDDTYLNYILSIDELFPHEALLRIFSDTVNANWHPITILSFYIDWKIAGFNPGYFHFINTLIHILNSLVLFIILKKLHFGKNAVIITLLFSIHPIQVEAVTWVSERKGLLSAIFSFSSIYFYLCSKEGDSKKNILYALLFFMLGVMSKASLVILPVLFVVIDWYRLEKKQFIENIPLLIKEKTIFFVVAILLSVVTILVHSKSGALSDVTNFSLSERVANSLIAYKIYVVNIFYPVNFSVFYPYFDNVSTYELLLSIVLLGVVFFVSIKFSKKHPYVLFGWLWFIISLLPVIGLIKTGAHSHADRYMYFPSVGIFIIAVLTLNKVISRIKVDQQFLWVVIISILMIISFFQIRHWKDSFTLFEHALLTTTKNYIAHRNLASAYLSAGQVDKGMKHYNESRNIRQISKDLYLVVVDKLLSAKRIDLAADVLNDMLDAGYQDYKIHLTLGQIRINQKKYKDAIVTLNIARSKKPGNFSVQHSLGAAYYFMGNYRDALVPLEIAHQIKKKNIRNLELLIIAYRELKDSDKVEHYASILRQLKTRKIE